MVSFLLKISDEQGSQLTLLLAFPAKRSARTSGKSESQKCLPRAFLSSYTPLGDVVAEEGVG